MLARCHLVLQKMERCQSGRLGRSRKPLWVSHPPWVRIPPSPLNVYNKRVAQLPVVGGRWTEGVKRFCVECSRYVAQGMPEGAAKRLAVFYVTCLFPSSPLKYSSASRGVPIIVLVYMARFGLSSRCFLSRFTKKSTCDFLTAAMIGASF